jgi:hypothetical protein
VWGDPTDQTPYCTHSKNHWDDYSEGFGEDYTQYWFLERFPKDVEFSVGDLSDPTVIKIYNKMVGRGNELLIGQADSDFRNPILDRNDENTELYNLKYGNECEKIFK